MIVNIIYILLISAFFSAALVKPMKNSAMKRRQIVSVFSSSGDLLAEYYGPADIKRKKKSDEVIISQKDRRDKYYGVTVEITHTEKEYTEETDYAD